MKINLRVRLANKNFWVAFIPAALLLIQAAAGIFGFEIDLGDIGNKLLEFVNAAFVVLALVGVVQDPTTAGFGDSERALGYDKPFEDEVG